MKSLRVFIVEDSSLIRKNLVATLEELAPVQVVGGAAGELDAVLQLGAQSLQCDLVIIDIMLEQGNGLGVLAEPAVHRAGRRFVVLSSFASADVRQRALHLGADRVFDKSREIEGLIDYCRELAASRP